MNGRKQMNAWYSLKKWNETGLIQSYCNVRMKMDHQSFHENRMKIVTLNYGMLKHHILRPPKSPVREPVWTKGNITVYCDMDKNAVRNR